jgi:hypothetical protein
MNHIAPVVHHLTPVFGGECIRFSTGTARDCHQTAIGMGFDTRRMPGADYSGADDPESERIAHTSSLQKSPNPDGLFVIKIMI